MTESQAWLDVSVDPALALSRRLDCSPSGGHPPLWSILGLIQVAEEGTWIGACARLERFALQWAEH